MWPVSCLGRAGKRYYLVKARHCMEQNCSFSGFVKTCDVLTFSQAWNGHIYPMLLLRIIFTLYILKWWFIPNEFKVLNEKCVLNFEVSAAVTLTLTSDSVLYVLKTKHIALVLFSIMPMAHCKKRIKGKLELKPGTLIPVCSLTKCSLRKRYSKRSSETQLW